MNIRNRSEDPRVARIKTDMLEMKAERMRTDALRATERHALAMLRARIWLLPRKEPIGRSARAVFAFLVFCLLTVLMLSVYMR